MKKIAVALLLSFLGSGCQSTSGDQSTSGQVAKGTPLRNRVADLQKRLEKGPPRDYEVAEYFLVAETLMQQKQFDAAEKFYKAVFDVEPSLVVGIKLARIKGLQRNNREAEDILKKLALFYPRSPDPALELAQQYQMQGNRSKTLVTLEEVYRKHPASEDVAARFAEYLIDSGQKDRAKKILTDSLKRMPTSQYFLLKLAQLKAEDKHFGEAKNLLNTLMRFHPDNVEAWALAGFIASEENNVVAAEKYFREAFDKQPDNDSLARFYVIQLLKQNKFEEARRLLLRLESGSDINNPLDAELSFQLAFVLYQLEDFAEAKKRFLALIEKTSDPSRLYYYAGQCDELLKNFAGARESYSKIASDSGFSNLGVQRQIYIAVELGEFDVAKKLLATHQLRKEDGESAYRFIASIYAKLKDYKKAVKVIQDGKKLFPRSVELAYLSAAYLEYTHSRQTALSAIEKFVQKNPNFTPALNHLGYMLADSGVRLDYAASLLKRAVQQEPKNGFYRDSLGWAYFRLKKYDDAEKELLAAYSAEKEEPVVIEHLGELKYAKQQYSEALKYFEIAESQFASKAAWKIESDPEWKQSFERVKKRLKELRQMALPKGKES